MSTIRPFAAIRYATPPDRDISTRLSPPYDILDRADKEALLSRDSKNFVALDLPHVPAKAAGPPELYAAAASTLRRWLSDGTLIRDPEPMIYVYHQRFQHEGRSYTRRMFFARLRLEPFGTGTVFPHEQTFGGPKEDRLCLTKATGANLSPIFGLYEDPAGQVISALEEGLDAQPLARGTLDGVENLLWGVKDRQRIAAAIELMAPRPIYIADGHHRYGTGLLHQEWYIREHGPLAPEHPANFVLTVFCAMEDPGLVILPTHRVLKGVQVLPDLLRRNEQLEVSQLAADSPAAALSALAGFGPQAVALHCPAAGGYWTVRPRRPDLLDAIEPKHSPAWRRLALSFLHAYLIPKVVVPSCCAGNEPTIQYVKDAQQAAQEARASGGSAFLLQATTMDELRSVCRAGDLMPQKSTYFYPKLASGLVINPLTDQMR
jgi:uncharacterized protein (DUF1015 family)